MREDTVCCHLQYWQVLKQGLLDNRLFFKWVIQRFCCVESTRSQSLCRRPAPHRRRTAPTWPPLAGRGRRWSHCRLAAGQLVGRRHLPPPPDQTGLYGQPATKAEWKNKKNYRYQKWSVCDFFSLKINQRLRANTFVIWIFVSQVLHCWPFSYSLDLTITL